MEAAHALYLRGAFRVSLALGGPRPLGAAEHPRAGGPDAQDAVDKVRTATLKMHQLNDNGLEERCTGFRLREVVLVAEAVL